jgi:DNA helicase HerA-like ATPase
MTGIDEQGLATGSAAIIGRVIGVKGSHVELGLNRIGAAAPARVTVGSFVAIAVGSTSCVGVITSIADQDKDPASADRHFATASLDVVGEIEHDPPGQERFNRGVSVYPTIDDTARIVTREHMSLIYRSRGARSIEIGQLFHDKSMPASIDVDSLLGRHFAVLGSTGVGKSSGVAVMLREILDARPDLRVFLLDCHNEYDACFGERAHVINSRDIKLPFWLFNFEEFVDVIYAGRGAIDDEVEILAELIPIAKTNYLQYKQAERFALKRTDPKTSGYTVDTPVPYLLQDLMALLDERMGKLENRSSRMNYHRLMARLDMIRNNPRYDFMFENANVGGDTMAEILNTLFRIEPAGKPITVMQLAGLPAEVVDATVSVLCRMAFDFGLWSDGAVPLLFVCEEAHRYAATDQAIGFVPTRRALSRIAKEGRKYGVYLGLVSQRPSELDPNIISQCATLFAMRMGNDRDHALLRSAISDTAAELLAFVPSLSTREFVAFGEGVPFPARMKFKMLPSDCLLRNGRTTQVPVAADCHNQEFVQSVVDRWRRSITGRKGREDVGAPMAAPVEPVDAVSAASRLDQARYQLLKR